MSHARTVELFWAGRVRTGSKKVFDYGKDYEVACRFKEILTREQIYKEIQKINWPFTKIAVTSSVRVKDNFINANAAGR